MNNISKSLMVFFFILVGFSVHALQLPVSSNFKVLYEQRFNKKIGKVAFDSYEKNGSIMYYPKIIVFSESDDFTVYREYKDERYDDKKVFRKVQKEIRIFSPQGRMRASIKGDKYNFYAGGDIYFSNNGSYFAIMQVVREEEFYSKLTQLYFSREERRKMEREDEEKLRELVREKYETKYDGLIKPSYRVYNDKGELLWEKEKLRKTEYPPEDIKISPVDGSVLYSFISRLGYYKIIDPSGNKRKAFPPELDSYIIDGLRIRFSKDWKYKALGFEKYPTDFYRTLPGKSSEPGIALLDSNWNILWKKSLENYLLSSVLISSQGSYIAAATYTMSGVDDKSPAKWTGYLFDKKGNLVMNLPLGGGLWRKELYPFSENEQYFAIPNGKHLSFIDISERKVLYKSDFPSGILALSVSNDGKCAILIERHEHLEYYPKTRRPIKSRHFPKVYVVDVKGDITWDSGELEGTSIHLLGWDNGNPIIGIMDKKTGEIKIAKVLIEEKER